MAIEIWRPTREMQRLTDEMERLMQETWGPFGRRLGELMPQMRMFPVNMYRKNNDVIVEAPLPGIRPEDVDVSISGQTLTIRAERKETKEVKEEEYVYREMAAGRIYRQLMLPTDVQADKAEANFENGTLRLRLPVAATSKEAHIKVKAAGNPKS